MNIDTFKQYFIMNTQKYSFGWSELDYQGEGCRLLAPVYGLPNYPYCFVTVDLEKESISINFHLNEAAYSPDTLKLVNDFNEHVPFVKAFITQYNDKNYLAISAGDFFITSEEDGTHTFLKFFNYIQSKEVESFLRPLTVITRY